MLSITIYMYMQTFFHINVNLEWKGTLVQRNFYPKAPPAPLIPPPSSPLSFTFVLMA